ncbi:acyl-CoA dehydrogenase family protein [Sporosarcina ureilytica]|uniref:Acyl-CoA dehydrogenase n=1 Tax=Sporosarcina ureilytica TaxID=298596 RepID=A0A1D8JGI2_9BACL|nr:acyl-CoA dehydrogenase family protein [Sporosarcina ureilytica]AOV07839.1 acyl-CoA dehydrogenase [Sporosarcina ureilytica]
MINLFVKTERQKIWLEKLYKLETKLKENAARTDELAIFPKDNIQALVDLGYTSITLPEVYGGAGLKVYDMVLLQETIASFDGNTGLSIGWNLGVVGDLFEKQSWEEDQLAYFAQEVKNGALVNRSVSEAITGSPARGGRPGTTAILKDGSWIINGRKSFTTASPVLTYFLTSAWIEVKQKIGFFLLHKDLDGLSIDETWDVISMRGTGSHDLVLENVTVNESKLVELPDKPSGKYNGWMLHIPACYLGIAQAARDYAVRFANEHTPNSLTGPISQLPNVQQHLGEIDLKLTQARHLIYSVAEAYDDETRRDLIINDIEVAKHTVTNAAIEVVDKAMRVVGAKSLGRANPLQRYYRDVRAGLHNPPMDDMTISRLAKSAIENVKNESVIQA